MLNFYLKIRLGMLINVMLIKKTCSVKIGRQVSWLYLWARQLRKRKFNKSKMLYHSTILKGVLNPNFRPFSFELKKIDFLK